MNPTTIKVSRGPAIITTGEIIASDTWETRNGRIMVIEFWQTQGGALIGVRRSWFEDDPESVNSEAVVIEPREDIAGMRLDLLDWFEWEHRARGLAKKLKWRLERHVA